MGEAQPQADFIHAVAIRWPDCDANGHVNNAVFLTYLEAGRDAFFARNGLLREQNVLASVSLDLLLPITLDAEVAQVSVACDALGTTSITTVERIEVAGARVARARSVSVTTDEEGRPVPIPELIRARLKRGPDPVEANVAPRPSDRGAS
jgi:acyl-CoA thioester hydrolase